MKKTVLFMCFGETQTIYFDILRLCQFEKRMGDSINRIVFSQNGGVEFAIAGLTIGLQHHYDGATEEFIVGKMDEHFERGGTLDELVTPVATALMISGIFGDQQQKNAAKEPVTVK